MLLDFKLVECGILVENLSVGYWFILHAFNMIHVLMNPSYNLSDLVLSLIVIEKMQLLLSA